MRPTYLSDAQRDAIIGQAEALIDRAFTGGTARVLNDRERFLRDSLAQAEASWVADGRPSCTQMACEDFFGASL